MSYQSYQQHQHQQQQQQQQHQQHQQQQRQQQQAQAQAYAGNNYNPNHHMARTAAAPRPPDAPLTRCWGAEFKGGDCSTCEPGFSCGKVHFKNKFCACCRAGVDVEAFRIRPLSPELQIAFANSQSEGFWKTGPSHLGGGMLRIVNNTAACVGPWLVIYRDEPPGLQWGELPAKWISEGYVRLCVAKGTLVPERELRGKSLTRKRDGFAPTPHPKAARMEDLVARDPTTGLPYQTLAAPLNHPSLLSHPMAYCGTINTALGAPTTPYCVSNSGAVAVAVAPLPYCGPAAVEAQAQPQPQPQAGEGSPSRQAVEASGAPSAAGMAPGMAQQYSLASVSSYDPNAFDPGSGGGAYDRGGGGGYAPQQPGVPNYGLPTAAYPDAPALPVQATGHGVLP